MTRERFDELCKSTPHIHQDKDEFWKFLELISPLKIEKILELGTAHGGTALIFQEVGEQVLSIDYGPLEGGIPPDRFKPSVQFITADTHDPKTLDIVKAMMPEIDLLFIDGDHYYEGVKADWEMYSPLVRPGGVVGFHDTAYGRTREPDSLIKSGKFFDEIVNKRKDEIILEHGIGVVYF